MKKIAIVLATTALMASPVFAGDAAAGKAKSAMCGACHGAAGVSALPMYPNLAGQKEAYLSKQLKDFKSGARKDPVMSSMAAPLSDADVVNLAAYFASLK
ncbi:MAG: cytochrome c [Alteromonadaceae bacterium]|nr:cytochrome c [Alteromonadaceae bacterium]